MPHTDHEHGIKCISIRLPELQAPDIYSKGS